MSRLYVAISAIMFTLVAVGHLLRLALGWEVQIGGGSVAMSVSWAALVVSAALAVWGGMVLRRWVG